MCTSDSVVKPANHLGLWQARRREVMRQQRIEEEAVTDAAEQEYQVTDKVCGAYKYQVVCQPFLHDQC